MPSYQKPGQNITKKQSYEIFNGFLNFRKVLK